MYERARALSPLMRKLISVGLDLGNNIDWIEGDNAVAELPKRKRRLIPVLNDTPQTMSAVDYLLLLYCSLVVDILILAR